jgi:phosphoglycerol transferase MdoB-like AlkP superfamily enzyme
MSPKNGSRKSLTSSLLAARWQDEPLGRAGSIVFVAFYAVIVNVPYWISSREFGFMDRRGVFGIEFFAVGMIALFVRPFVSAILLLLAMTADMVFAICESYSISIPEILSNVGAYGSFSDVRRSEAAGIFLLAMLLIAVAWVLPTATIRKSDRWRIAGCLMGLLTLTLTSNVVTVWRESGHFPNPLKRSFRADYLETNWIEAPKLGRNFVVGYLRSVHGVVADDGPTATENGPPVPVASATDHALQQLHLSPGSAKPNIVIVLVESWGLDKDAAIREALTRPYANAGLQARYQVEEGLVPFYGGTIAGEARELCGNSMGFKLLSAARNELEGCLPARLAGLGYEDLAVHGMNGHLFRRSRWYKTIGFQEQWFNAELKHEGLPDCQGAFNGTCDADVAKWIGRRLEQSDPQPEFVHWMTLNSHLPVVVPPDLATGAACSDDLGLRPGTPLCSWYQLVANVHQSVAELAMGKMDRPTVFVIVGDHAPPFNDPLLRDRFSKTDVPYLLLLPRSEGGIQDRVLAQNSANLPGKTAKASRRVQ